MTRTREMLRDSGKIQGAARLVLIALVICPLGAPRAVAAQDLAMFAGAAAGAGAGLWLSAAYITAESRRGDFLDSDEEAVGMAALPLFTGLAAGVALGAFAEDRMSDTLVWGAVGWASGVGLGALIGDRVWADPQRRWAGGVIGGAVGMVVGGVAGLVSSNGNGEDAHPAAGLPLQIRLRF